MKISSKKIWLPLLCLLILCGCSRDIPPSESSAVTTNGQRISLVETTLFSLSYDADCWVIPESAVTDGVDACSLQLQQTEGNGTVQIYVNLEDGASYRQWLWEHDFQTPESLDMNCQAFGNLKLVCWENPWGDRQEYAGREEPSGASIYITVQNVEDAALIETLLRGITVTAEDLGKTDPPWPWEGSAFIGENHQTVVGSRVLNATWIPFQDLQLACTSLPAEMTWAGDTLWLLLDGCLKEVRFQGDCLEVGSAAALDGAAYERLDGLSDGRIALSGLDTDYQILQQGNTVARFEAGKIMAPAPDGSWGIGYGADGTCSLCQLYDGKLKQEMISAPELNLVDFAAVDEKYIYVCGSLTDTGTEGLLCYDHEWNLKTRFDALDGWLGGLCDIEKTKAGILGLDQVWGNLVLWNEDGSLKFSVPVRELLGLDDCQIQAGLLQEDGSLLLLVTVLRPDGSGKEAAVYRITGF